MQKTLSEIINQLRGIIDHNNKEQQYHFQTMQDQKEKKREINDSGKNNKNHTEENNK